jgi:hypothetical protein
LTHILELLCEEFCADIWTPATIMGLLMLWNINKAADNKVE